MSEKYALIAAEKADPTSPHKIAPMCAWLGVSTSGFYDWETAPVSARQPDLGDDGRGRSHSGDLIEPGHRRSERGQVRLDLLVEEGDVGVDA